MIEINFNGFGDPDYQTVVRLLCLTEHVLEQCTGINSPKDVIIRYQERGPECRNDGDTRIILLSAHDNYYGQWVYQYAHEYMHHLIDGAMVENLSGLMWFEETLCEAASRFVLWRLGYSDLCAREGLSHAFPTLLYYHDRCLSLDPLLKEEFRLNGSVEPWIPLLEQPCYHRSHYAVIADAMQPLFRTNCDLWHIAAGIGDSTQWRSLESLLSHLEKEFPEVSESVTRLKSVLLGS